MVEKYNLCLHLYSMLMTLYIYMLYTFSSMYDYLTVKKIKNQKK